MAEVFALIDKNRREKLRVARDSYQGVALVDLRVCVQLTESSGLWTPTKKGVSFREDMLTAVIEALQAAQAAIRAGGGS